MVVSQDKRAFGVLSTRQEAEYALGELQDSGFPMSQVSLIAPDADQKDAIAGVEVKQLTDEQETGIGAATGALAGGVTGGFVGLIGALSATMVPGFGPILVGGALASVIGDVLIGGTVGAAAGGLVGALGGLGVPQEQATVYNDLLDKGEYLVIIEGTTDELGRAASILLLRGIREWQIYDAPTNYGTGMGITSAGFATPAGAGATTAGAPMVGYPSPLGITPVDAATSGTTYNYLNQEQRAVGVFSTYQETEAALEQLKTSGFSLNKVSLIVRDADQHEDITGVKTKERISDHAEQGAATGALAGGALGGLTGLLVGLSSLAIPGIGSIIFAGAEAATITSIITGGAVGAVAGGLVGALVGLGIPEDRAKVYSDRVSAGDYLVIVKGSQEEISRAESILNGRNIQEWGIYNSPSAPMVN
ncbi:general stress protein [Lyngbya aestuarii]|uniref:general stress protein n=1 Tax=Lyngbya aestuarii TaxID=118322 RepID=UPI00403E30C7